MAWTRRKRGGRVGRAEPPGGAVGPMVTGRRELPGRRGTKFSVQAIHGVRTVPKIAMVFDVHPDLVADRKRRVFGLPPAILSGAQAPRRYSAPEKSDPGRKIGRLKGEPGFLKDWLADLWRTADGSVRIMPS